MASLLIEGSDSKCQAGSRCDAEQQQRKRDHQRERDGKAALRMDQTFLIHVRALTTKSEHELDMIDDPHEHHADAEINERHAEIAGGMAVWADHVLFLQALEELEDREAEADQRERRADHA